MLTASTSLWYLYALVVYFTLCKLLSRWKVPMLALLALASIAINFLPLPWWGMNSVVRNMIYYSLGAWYGASADGVDENRTTCAATACCLPSRWSRPSACGCSRCRCRSACCRLC